MAEENGPDGRVSSIAEAQRGVFEMGTVITQPGLKRADSTELLHLTLHQCARDGNVDDMQRLVNSFQGNKKKKINVHDDEDLSALHYAARYNHVEICKILVNVGANVNDKDEEGATPLHYAARYKRVRIKTSEEHQKPMKFPHLNERGEADEEEEEGDEDEPKSAETSEFVLDSTAENSVVMYLVSVGGNINEPDNYGCTPLHFAAMRGNELVTYELLQCKGINIEATDKQQMTSLHMAASNTEEEIARMLIEQGAELRCVDEDYCTPLHYAAMEGSLKIAEMLFEAAEKKVGWVNVKSMVSDLDEQQNTPLHLAVENRSHDVAKLCLEKGADVNKTTDNYSTPLHLAAVTGDIQLAKLLLHSKARIDALDINQSTPLHRAAAYNHSDVVKYLVSKGARIDKHDKDNFTPLLIAACNGHSDTIHTLLSLGAKLEDVDKNDKSALYWAAEEDNVGALKELLTYVGDLDDKFFINKGDRYDNTPLHISAKNGYISCVKALLDAGADSDWKNEEEQTPLHLAAKYGKTSAVKVLIHHDITAINDEDEDSNTPLHLAALAGHNKVAACLLETGADIEARNATLWTPLDCAAAKGWAKTCKILLEADSPVDPLDKSKTTPLHLACSRGHVQCVTLLLQWSANVSLRDSDGHNGLDLAIDNGNKDVAMAIVNCDKWKDALRNDTKDLKTGYRNTPMRKLIRKMPDVAERLFNRCTSDNGQIPDHPDYEITFNYEFLDDNYADWKEKDVTSETLSTHGSIYDEDDKLIEQAKPYVKDTAVLKKNHCLSIMVAENQEDLLAHPLVTSLLRNKWNSFGRWLYYTNLFIYCLFIVFLTGYICTTKAPYLFKKQPNVVDNTTQYQRCHADSCRNIREHCTDPDNKDDVNDLEQDLFTAICKYGVIVLACINMLREIIQIKMNGLQYVGNIVENVIEWVTYLSSILLVIDWSKCQQDNPGVREVWQWQLASVAILLAWLELVLFIRKIPRFGIFVVMFTDILWTFLQFLPVFFLVIIAFGLTFYVLFGNHVRFAKVEWSLLSTFVMMIGEMEYSDLFFGTEGATRNTQEYFDTAVYYKPITYAIFVVFVVLLTILIMNLLVGLAVDDIKAVQEVAVLKRMAMQVELALDVESLLPKAIQRRFVRKCSRISPNKSKTAANRLMNLESTHMTSAAIAKALNHELDDIELVQHNQQKMMGQVTTLRQRMKAMSQRNERIESMLKQIMKAQNIEFTEEDVNEEDLALLNV